LRDFLLVYKKQLENPELLSLGMNGCSIEEVSFERECKYSWRES